MRSSTGRPARILCVLLAVLSLAGAVVLLTDAVGTDDPEQAARLAALAPVLAMGSIMWMLGALVATAAASAANRSGKESPVAAPQQHYAQPAPQHVQPGPPHAQPGPPPVSAAGSATPTTSPDA